MTNQAVSDLITRSNRLGSDPKNTNYAGGNTSAKGTETDPVTGEPVELLWVKGSGGDLGTLTEPGLAVLRLDRMRALVDVYPGVEREDEMVAAFDYCLHGKGGAAPSIDTAMHGLVDAAHVDHLHPDSGIAIATAADGEALTKEIFGDQVVWVPWRRPGFQLGLDIAEIKDENPQAIGCVLGGHGITAWGDTSEESERNSLWIIDTAADIHRRERQGGAVRSGPGRLRRVARVRAAGQGGRVGPHAAVDRLAGQADGRSLHRFRRGAGVPGLERAPAAGRAGHELPGSLPADQGEAAGAGSPGSRERGGFDRPAAGAARGVPGRLPGLLRPQRHRRFAGHPRRGPVDHPGPGGRHVLLRQGRADRPGGGGVLRQRDQRDARRRRTVHATRRSTSRRSSGSSTGRWRRPSCSGCRSRSRWRRGSPWSPAPPPGSARPSPSARRRRCLRGDRRPRRRQGGRGRRRDRQR